MPPCSSWLVMLSPVGTRTVQNANASMDATCYNRRIQFVLSQVVEVLWNAQYATTGSQAARQTCTQNCELGTARADFQAKGTMAKSTTRGFQRHVICKDSTLPRISAISPSLGSGGAAGGEPERLVDETMWYWDKWIHRNRNGIMIKHVNKQCNEFE